LDSPHPFPAAGKAAVSNSDKTYHDGRAGDFAGELPAVLTL
jgi:hypothetical protein